MGGARTGGLFIKCDADRRGPIHYRQMIAGPPPPPRAVASARAVYIPVTPPPTPRRADRVGAKRICHSRSFYTAHHMHITAHARFYTTADYKALLYVYICVTYTHIYNDILLLNALCRRVQDADKA